jgi:hypothetical protein
MPTTTKSPSFQWLVGAATQLSFGRRLKN